MTLNIANDFKKLIFLINHPVGSLYFSGDNTNPNTFYGGNCGTWSKIEGQFIIGANSTYPVNSTGGSKTHYHWLPYFDWNDGLAILNTSQLHKRTSGITPPQDADNWWFNKTGMTGTTSGGGQHGTSDGSSLPPYIAKYIWVRTS